MSNKAKKTVKIIFDVLFWVFFAIAMTITVFLFASQNNAAGYPKFGDKALFYIRSDSMDGENGFKKGDLIVSRVLKIEEQDHLEVGDVITYYVDITPTDGIDNKVLNTHRIVKVDTETVPGKVRYETKGDNPLANVDDYLVASGDVHAVWTGKRVPVIGGVINFLNEPYGFWPCVVLPLCGFLTYEIIVLVNQVKAATGKGKRTITKADEELIKQQAIEEFLKKQEKDKTASDK